MDVVPVIGFRIKWQANGGSMIMINNLPPLLSYS